MKDPRPFPLAGARPQYGPDKAVDVLHIDLYLRPDLAAKSLDGVCTTTVEALDDDVRVVRLDAVDLLVEAVDDGAGAALAYRSTSDALTIEFAQPLAAGERTTFAVRYRVERPHRGLYFIDSPRQVWTQSQDQDARYWFPCFDHPAGKQTTAQTIVVPEGLFALGNGALTARTTEAGFTTFRYEQRVPHATYLTTLVAGEFSEIRQAHPRIPVWYYVTPGREADGERSFANTPRMIDAFEKVIGVPYPYERYSQIAVAEFIFGGMENTAASTQTDRTLHDERAHLDFSSDPLVSHELAHQWFGDLVTCRDWAQAWLNEGFATYFEAVWREADLGWDEYLYYVFTIVAEYLDEHGERYRRPIVCNVYHDPIELFDAHLYQKGGAVLHMLRGELGWERLRRSLTRYVLDNAERTVETIDFVRAIEGATGRNLRGFFAQWIERGGHADLEIHYRWDAERSNALLTIEQKQTIDDANPPYGFDIDAGFVAQAPWRIPSDAGDGPLPGETRMRLRVEHARETFAIPLDAQPALVRIDPGAYVLGTMVYQLGSEMHARILRSEPSVVSRIRAARALAKDRSRVASDSLAAALRDDPFWGVSAEVATELGSMRSPAARLALLGSIDHPHPKVRRSIAAALGAYRDPEVAGALIGLASDRSYFVAASSRTALGKTRDPRAFDELVAALAVPSWNDTIAAGAAAGLAELADRRALEPLLAASRRPSSEALRRAAVRALGRLGALVESLRIPVADALEQTFEDSAYLVRVSAYAAAETLGDARLLGSLDRLARLESDGRLRRDAAEAAIRVREAQKVPAEVVTMREELEKLRVELAALRDRLNEQPRT
jgi:aminopeptidase N